MKIWVGILMLFATASVAFGSSDPLQVVFAQDLISVVNWNVIARRVVMFMLLVYTMKVAHPVLQKLSKQGTWEWAEKLLVLLFGLLILVFLALKMFSVANYWQ